MPWDDTARAEHTRETGRYPTDLTDAEWEIIKPLLPPGQNRWTTTHDKIA